MAPSTHAHSLLVTFKRNIIGDLRLLRNALAIKKVKVWIADKRCFFFKNNIDERVGEGNACHRA